MPLMNASVRTATYYDPYDRVIDEDPYPVWKRLRGEQPLYYNKKHDFFALSRYEDVQRCLQDWRRYSSAKGTLLELARARMTIPPGTILFEDPPSHDLHRGLLAGVFTPQRIAALEPLIRAICARCLDPLVASGGFDFIADFAAKVPRETLRLLLNDAASSSHIDYANLLAAAGNETTARLIGWAGKVLAEHPDQRRQLARDPRLCANAIEELLRYESPSAVQARYLTEDVVHHGRLVAEGSIVLLLIASANRDERQFEDADRFDIHRPRNEHLAFGHGVHHCIGAGLARLQARIALEEVLKRFPEWEVDWARAVQAHTSTDRGWQTLPVRVP